MDINELLKMAKQGHVVAQYNLGIMYGNGQGTSLDYKQSAKWFSKAAEQGDASAQYNLGVLYEHGQGVPLNRNQAIKWYTKAAEQGDASAQHNLGVLYEDNQDYKQAINWYTKAADQGFIDSQLNLAAIYIEDRGVPQDWNQVLKWYTMAAKQGDANAQYNLVAMYANEGDFQNYVEAYAWSLHAEMNGNSEPRDILAKSLTPDQIVAGQARAKELQEEMDKQIFSMEVDQSDGLSVSVSFPEY